MTLKLSARGYLRTATYVYDSQRPVLEPLALRVGNFCSGAEWMAEVLHMLRGSDVANGRERLAFNLWGACKYGVASLAALLTMYLAISSGIYVAVIIVPFVFYALEVQTLFLFPLLIDGSVTPLRESRRLLLRLGGTMIGMSYVTQFAVYMLFGGLAGAGITRSWCVGCIAVLLCYEELQGNPRTRHETMEEVVRCA